MPVRNGGATLQLALDSMVNQDYPNLEIVVSDNASDDSTSDILQHYAARYEFIRIFRQDKPLTAYDNFMFVLRQARGEFFAWCAHDDTRSLNFVSGLLQAFADPQAVLAFGDLYVWDGEGPPSFHADYRFSTEGLPRWRRLRKAALMQCFHFYGLWRIDPLRHLEFCYARWWGDLPIMMGMAANGVFRHVPGVLFQYFEAAKSTEARAYAQNFQAPAALLINLLDVCRSCFVTVARAAGVLSGVLAFCFVVEKFARQTPKSFSRRFLERR